MATSLEESGIALHVEGESLTSLSVVVEWENVVLAGDERALKMLRSLASQLDVLIARPSLTAEVLVVVDTADDVEGIEMTLREFFPVHHSSLSLRAVDAGGAKYHEKKNVGAARARGAILVFLDSDVIPEEGWLERIYDSFGDSNVQVVAGTTYLDRRGIYSSSMAAFWFFPLRNPGDELAVAETLFANNIAFRRNVFHENPFPVLDQFRGQCGTLIKSLKERGIPVHQRGGARCSHPAPNGLVHFVRRAICQGYDNVARYRRENGPVPGRISYWTLRKELPHYFRRIKTLRADVGLSRPGALVARLIAVGYTLGIMTGEQLTRISPPLVRRWFSI